MQILVDILQCLAIFYLNRAVTKLTAGKEIPNPIENESAGKQP